MKPVLCFLLMSIFFINCDKKQYVETITTLELKELLATKDIQLMDVRAPEEISEGFIETAVFANYFDDDFKTKASNQLDKSKIVYLYCRSGNRSEKAGVILKEVGFNVIHVSGGFNQWKKEK
jgi:rhodanese-related sulfurtransferase